MLDYKASLGKFKKAEIISSIFPTMTVAVEISYNK